MESAKVLLVFLSKAYLESVNCQLEFCYAAQRGKAFVIIRTEPNIRLDPWMTETIKDFPQYDVFAYQDVEALINGVPKVNGHHPIPYFMIDNPFFCRSMSSCNPFEN